MKTMSRFTQILLILALLAGMVGLTPAQPVRAATIVVNSDIGAGTLDTIGNGTCDLREAIENANNDNQLFPDCAKGNGADTITFADNYTITLTDGQLPLITSHITINGRGSAFTTIEANENPNVASYRVFNVLGSNAASLTLNNLTVRHGRCNGSCETVNNFGGGIYVGTGGALNLNNVYLIQNSADFGGGLYSNGNTNIANSTLALNSSTNGGGIQTNFGTLNVRSSSIIYNGASADGGGIWTSSNTTAFITNSTIAHNNAGDDAGGIHNGGSLAITNSTIANNTDVDTAGGIVNLSDGVTTVQNSIIASNSAPNCWNSLGTLTVNNVNLSTDASCGSATQKTVGELNLGGIINNGGPTFTIPLLPGSHAIDTGDNTVCNAAPVNKVDQRGVKRPKGPACDVGAFEAGTDAVFRSTGSNDGWILEADEFSNTGGSLNKGAKTINIGDDASNRQYRTILSFNTSSVPVEATISKVILRFKRQGVTGGGNPITTFGGFMVDIKKGNFGNAGLQLGDFNAKAGKTYGAFKPKLVGGWYSINLTKGKGLINRDGNTQIRLRFKVDDNNNSVANFLKIYSGNAATTSRPQLIVEHYVP